MIPCNNRIINLIANFLIACGLFALFSNWGQIHITSDWPLWQIVLAVGLVNIISSIIVVLAEVILSPFTCLMRCCTLGLANVLILGAVQYATLWLSGRWTGLYYFDPITAANWWPALFMGLVFALVKFRTYGGGSSSSSRSTYSYARRSR